MNQETLQAVIDAIDAINSHDPAGNDSLEYSTNMTGWLGKLNSDPSAELQIAVRAQHVKRWAIPRSDYPMDRPGYLKWRKDLGKMHAEIAAEEVVKNGGTEEEAARVASIIRKEGIKRDAETQTLEDCACLVFLENDFEEFSTKYEEPKLISIVQKTWNKMSEQAHAEALKLSFSDNALELIKKALS